MRIEMLRQNKIKILIDCDDLLKWGLSAQNVLENAPETREMFVEILKKAEQETGFRCNNSKLVIESSINSENEVLTLYVTRVASEEENELFDKISYQHKVQDLNSMQNKRGNLKIIAFKTFEDVIKMCKALGTYNDGELYTYRDIYFVSAPEEFSELLSEFGELCRDSLGAIVKEHGKRIIDKNAFSIVRQSF